MEYKSSECSRIWNKNHREKCNYAYRQWHARFVQNNGFSFNTRENRESQKHATMARQQWGPVEDALLFCGKTHRQLSSELGRSMKAVERRIAKIRKLDLANP
jgi:hypothetical protein